MSQEVCSRAAQLAKQGVPEKGIELLRPVIRDEESNATAIAAMAYCHEKAGALRVAIYLYSEAIRRNPQAPQWADRLVKCDKEHKNLIEQAKSRRPGLLFPSCVALFFLLLAGLAAAAAFPGIVTECIDYLTDLDISKYSVYCLAVCGASALIAVLFAGAGTAKWLRYRDALRRATGEDFSDGRHGVCWHCGLIYRRGLRLCPYCASPPQQPPAPVPAAPPEAAFQSTVELVEFEELPTPAGASGAVELVEFEEIPAQNAAPSSPNTQRAGVSATPGQAMPLRSATAVTVPAIIALVLGGLGLPVSLLPIVGFLGLFATVPAFILSLVALIIALVKRTRKGLAIAAVIIAILSIAVPFIEILFLSRLIHKAESKIGRAETMSVGDTSPAMNSPADQNRKTPTSLREKTMNALGKGASIPAPNASANDMHKAESRETTVDLGGGVTLDLVWVPGGTFTMGSPEGEAGRGIGEDPVHKVTLSEFWMGKFEVTQAQYEAIMVSNPSVFKGMDNPVEMVSWNDATEFCRKLSQKTGENFVLPSEAQWEYACRANTTTPLYTGSTTSPMTDLEYSDVDFANGNRRKNVPRNRTVAVGQFAPNAFGLYDMPWNVMEWCQDWYHDSYAGAPTDGSAWESPAGNGRVLRGLSWRTHPMYCRATCRGVRSPNSRYADCGFRVVAVDAKPIAASGNAPPKASADQKAGNFLPRHQRPRRRRIDPRSQRATIPGSGSNRAIFAGRDLTLARVKVGGKWGYSDRDGKMVIKRQFRAAEDFYGGLALVNSTDDQTGIRLLNPWVADRGYVNREGEYIWRAP